MRICHARWLWGELSHVDARWLCKGYIRNNFSKLNHFMFGHWWGNTSPQCTHLVWRVTWGGREMRIAIEAEKCLCEVTFVGEDDSSTWGGHVRGMQGENLPHEVTFQGPCLLVPSTTQKSPHVANSHLLSTSCDPMWSCPLHPQKSPCVH